MSRNGLDRVAAGAAVVALLWALPALAPRPAEAAGEVLQEALRHLQADDVLLADAAVDELVAVGPPAVDALLPLLEDERRDVRAGAIRALGRLGDDRAVLPIRRQLEDSLALDRPDTMRDRYLRILAIQALGRLRDPESGELLRRVAGSGDAFERAHAGIALFLSGADPGYDLVRECLDSPDMAIRNLAVEGLAESDDPRVPELVLPRTRDDSWVVRDSAFRTLAAHRDRDDVREAFGRGATDPSWYVRETVAEIEGRGRS
jgi:HEAT repeat protein